MHMNKWVRSNFNGRSWVHCLSAGLTLVVVGLGTQALAQPGEAPALGPRIDQSDLPAMTLVEIRTAGRRIFSTPFNELDGLGDGALNRQDKVSPGGRTTLQGNGTFLRMNGLDSQACLECHSSLSTATIPAKFAVGGAGGAAQSALPGVINPDVDDSENNGYARILGRLINPPFCFGAGGIEQLAHEMTVELQAARQHAQLDVPDSDVLLVAKGVNFGSIRFDSASGEFDISKVEGIGEDLVVRPFGRKGCCSTIREFDRLALPFHQGIQPVEVVGVDVDQDEDGVVNELSVGEMSALHVFQVALDAPVQEPLQGEALAGRDRFLESGCANCHRPMLDTSSRALPLAFPEVPTDPRQNTYGELDLGTVPGFAPSSSGSGVAVPLYADLKLHDMGDKLAEAPQSQNQGIFRARLARGQPPQPGNRGANSGNGNGHGDGVTLDAARFFTTARLWGVADSAPYLHDGRASTLTAAIMLHGGEAQTSAEAFTALSDAHKAQLLAFLRSLRTPATPSADLP